MEELINYLTNIISTITNTLNNQKYPSNITINKELSNLIESYYHHLEYKNLSETLLSSLTKNNINTINVNDLYKYFQIKYSTSKEQIKKSLDNFKIYIELLSLPNKIGLEPQIEYIQKEIKKLITELEELSKTEELYLDEIKEQLTTIKQDTLHYLHLLDHQELKREITKEEYKTLCTYLTSSTKNEETIFKTQSTILLSNLKHHITKEETTQIIISNQITQNLQNITPPLTKEITSPDKTQEYKQTLLSKSPIKTLSPLELTKIEQLLTTLSDIFEEYKKIPQEEKNSATNLLKSYRDTPPSSKDKRTTEALKNARLLKNTEILIKQMEKFKQSLKDYNKFHQDYIENKQKITNSTNITKELFEAYQNQTEEINTFIEEALEDVINQYNNLISTYELYKTTIKETIYTPKEPTTNIEEKNKLPEENILIFLKDPNFQYETLFEQGLQTNGFGQNNTITDEAKASLKTLLILMKSRTYNQLNHNYGRTLDDVKSKTPSGDEKTVTINNRPLQRISQIGERARISLIQLSVPDINKEKLGIQGKEVILIINSYEISYTKSQHSKGYRKIHQQAEEVSKYIKKIMDEFSNPQEPKENLEKYIETSTEDYSRILKKCTQESIINERGRK